MEPSPVIDAGCAGFDFTVTYNSLEGPVPFELFAATLILLEVADGVTVKELVEELPVQPTGKVQVYEVASPINSML
jgi:hypothetical protein